VAHERTAKKLDINLIHLPLAIGSNKKEWRSPLTGNFVTVEKGVLDYYRNDGWRGYSGEGGLILNLIKSMSFPALHMRHRSTYIEGLYAQNSPFNEDRFEIDLLLRNVKCATEEQVRSNFEVMVSKESFTTNYGLASSTSCISMLDFFPDLELYMFLELFKALGCEKIFQIAEIFSEDPYKYRKGWPDLTIWKNGKVKFLEVKSPGDRLHSSQKTIIASLIKPLMLDYSLVDVTVEN